MTKTKNKKGRKGGRRRGCEEERPTHSRSGRVYRIYLAMSNQLSAFYGIFRGFLSIDSQLLYEGRGVRYHLHSTASTFWGGEDDEGLIPVSEEAEDMEAPV